LALVLLTAGLVGVAAPVLDCVSSAKADEAASRPRSVVVPGFWDPRRRPERPDLSRLQTIRFLTETDYPPFAYAGSDGNPAGFNVDLARLLCDEIKANCTIQARRYDTLLDALNDNRGDAVIASIAPTAETRRKADFTDPYYRTPARFAAGTTRGPQDRGRCRHRA
jgi:polar amino acid transport system substrate-binding protein